MSICVITSWPPKWADPPRGNGFARITTSTLAAYCDKHGYDFVTDCSDIHDPATGEPILGFVKLDLLQANLHKYDACVWIDADVVVTNDEVRIEDVFPHSDIIMAPYDWNGHNATVMYFPNTALVHGFIHACNDAGRKMFMGHIWREMEAMRYFSQTEPYSGIAARLSARLLCPVLPAEYVPWGVPLEVSMPYAWEPGSWLLHLPALPDQRRLELAIEYAGRAAQSADAPLGAVGEARVG